MFAASCSRATNISDAIRSVTEEIRAALGKTEPGVMMPELPRRLVPDEAVGLIREWISQMKAPIKQASAP